MANAYESKLAGGGTAPTGNATVADVLAPKTFSNADGVGLVGTMPNNGAVSGVATPSQPYTIPEGYHNGSGVVTASAVIPAIELNGASNASCNYLDVADLKTKGFTSVTLSVVSGSGTADIQGANSAGAAPSGRIGQATASTPYTTALNDITAPFIFFTVANSGSTVAKLTIS